MSAADLALARRQMATLLGAGISLDEVLPAAELTNRKNCRLKA